MSCRVVRKRGDMPVEAGWEDDGDDAGADTCCKRDLARSREGRRLDACGKNLRE